MAAESFGTAGVIAGIGQEVGIVGKELGIAEKELGIVGRVIDIAGVGCVSGKGFGIVVAAVARCGRRGQAVRILKGI